VARRVDVVISCDAAAGVAAARSHPSVDQKAAIALFESLGFKAEADHVRALDGKNHDIVVLGHDVAQVRTQNDLIWRYP
jgi:hypothetical protein